MTIMWLSQPRWPTRKTLPFSLLRPVPSVVNRPGVGKRGSLSRDVGIPFEPGAGAGAAVRYLCDTGQAMRIAAE